MLKTKFHNVPTSERARLRGKARSYLAHIQANHPDRLTRDMRYILPDKQRRGYLVLVFDDWISIRFMLSPGKQPGDYIADKIEFVYQVDDRAVTLEVTREDWLQEYFASLQGIGAVQRAMESAYSI